MVLSAAVRVDKAAIEAFCRRNGIRRLSVFGSALRADFRPDSDVDVLVEFEPGRVPGYRFFDLQDELSGMLGLRVDLNTPKFLSPRIRERAQDSAQVLYAGD